MEQKHYDKFTDDEFIEKYYELKKLSFLSSYFNVPDITIWRRAKKLGLEFKIGGKNEKIDLYEILDGKHPHFQTNKLKKKLLSEKILDYKCAICEISEWRSKEIVLQLDHIDGDSHNHKLDNLRLLCPNCHTQTNTWCGKNKIAK